MSMYDPLGPLVLLDAAKQNDEWEERGKVSSDLAIPLLMQNRIPEGFETDDKLDVSLRPAEVSIYMYIDVQDTLGVCHSLNLEHQTSNSNIYTSSVFCYDKHKKNFDIQFSMKRHETV